MRRVGATGTCTRDKHEDGPDDTYMGVLSEPDNIAPQLAAATTTTTDKVAALGKEMERIFLSLIPLAAAEKAAADKVAAEKAAAEEAAAADKAADKAAIGKATAKAAMEGVAAMTRQETVGRCKEMQQHIRPLDTAAATSGNATTEKAVGGCREMIKHIRQINTAAATAGEATLGGPRSRWLLQQEVDEAKEVKMFGAFISPGRFEDVWDVWVVGEDV